MDRMSRRNKEARATLLCYSPWPKWKVVNLANNFFFPRPAVAQLCQLYLRWPSHQNYLALFCSPAAHWPCWSAVWYWTEQIKLTQTKTMSSKRPLLQRKCWLILFPVIFYLILLGLCILSWYWSNCNNNMNISWYSKMETKRGSCSCN